KRLCSELTKRIKEQANFDLQNQAQSGEIDRYKEAIRELTIALQDARQQVHSKENELVLKLQATCLDNQETKSRLLRLIADKKELEDKLTSLSCEKATIAARLQSLSQKSLASQETELQLTQTIKELTQTLEETTQELEKTQAKRSEEEQLA